MRRVLARLVQLVLAAGMVGLLVLPSAPAAEPAGVVLNEVNCTGTDWIELVNAGGTDASIGGWLLTDDALDRVPLRDTHRLRLPADTVLAAGARLVVTQGTGGSPSGSRAATTRFASPTPTTPPSTRSCSRCSPRVSARGGASPTEPEPGR
jgi:lamin tail-like protein